MATLPTPRATFKTSNHQHEQQQRHSKGLDNKAAVAPATAAMVAATGAIAVAIGMELLLEIESSDLNLFNLFRGMLQCTPLLLSALQLSWDAKVAKLAIHSVPATVFAESVRAWPAETQVMT